MQHRPQPAACIWQLIALLVLICIANPSPAEAAAAAASRHRHGSHGRSLQATNVTSITTRRTQTTAKTTNGCGTKSPTEEVKQAIRQKIAQQEAAAKRKAAAAAARRGGVGVASTPSSGAGLSPPTTAAISLIFHIIVDDNAFNTAPHRTLANNPGHPERAVLPTCQHLTDARLQTQVDMLNAAYRGVFTFSKKATYRYQIGNPTGGVCFESPSCPNNPIPIRYNQWWDTRSSNGIYGDPDTFKLVEELAKLSVMGSSPSQINVFMWDWDAPKIYELGLSTFYAANFNPSVWAVGYDMVIVHCETAPGGTGSKVDLDPGDLVIGNPPPWYSTGGSVAVPPAYVPPVYNGGELIHQMGHALGLYHPEELGCVPPFGGDEVEDTPAEEDRDLNTVGHHLVHVMTRRFGALLPTP